jgi:DNA-binding beta-propeller fold protein YncE
VLDQTVVAVPATPYRGIQPFRYVDHAIFFAREDETRRLASLVAVYRGIMLYGGSGSGKSSLINAGLLPGATRLGFHPERLRVQPRSGEELVIERITTADDDTELLPSLLAPGDESSPRIVLSTQSFEERLRAACQNHRPLLIFDQFEEILTLFEQSGGEDAQQRLVKLIVALLHEPLPPDEPLPVKLLFAFREDYLGKVKQLLEACPELVDQALRLAPPAAVTLSTIIRGPFERYPGHFARELTSEVADRLCAALAERFGAGELSLSEIQTVCLRLWQADEPEALLAAKGPQGLLEDYLGEALDAFPPDLRGAAIAVLGQMVTSAGTRNVMSAEDVIQRAQENENVPPALSERALERLESESKLVRRERRRDLYLYEITSEFLLPWIRRRHEEYRRLQDRARERRRLGLLGSIAAALLLAVIFLIVSSGDDGPEPAEVVGTAVKVGGVPVGLADDGEGGVWVTDRSEEGRVSLIEATPDNQVLERSFEVGERPEGVTVGDDGSIWVANGGSDSVSRLDPEKPGKPGREIDLGEHAKPGEIAVGDDGSIWVANGDSDSVSRLDPEKPGKPGPEIYVGNDPYGVAVGWGFVWVTNRKANSVSQVDPGRAKQTGEPLEVGATPKGIDLTGDAVWVANTDGGTVSRIDRESLAVEEFEVGTEPRGVVAAFDSVWVSLGGNDQVARLDPESGEVIQRIDVGAGPDGITAGPQGVWVANGEDGTVSRISP